MLPAQRSPVRRVAWIAAVALAAILAGCTDEVPRPRAPAGAAPPPRSRSGSTISVRMIGNSGRRAMPLRQAETKPLGARRRRASSLGAGS
jgi:hypothetical protein